VLHRKTIALAVTLAWAAPLSITYAQQNDAVANPAAVTTLPEVKVTASDDASSELTHSYAAHAVTVGSKIPQTLRETPQSISVVTRQRMDDQNITKIEDVLKQTTGVNVTRLDGAGNFNSIQARGFDIGTIQLDGLAISQGANYSTALDTAIYDRIEVLRGPAGLLQGAGEPGGTINLVRKRARADFAGSVGFMLGSWDTRRAEFDLTSKLDEAGRIRARVVGLVDDRESFVNTLQSKKNLGYGTVEIDLTSRTTLSLGLAHQKVDSVVDQGLPALANYTLPDVSRSTFIGSRDNVQDMQTDDMFAELEHKFDDGGLFKFAARQIDRSMLYKSLRANGLANVTTGLVDTQTVGFQQETRNVNLDAYYAGPFQLGGRTHKVLVGVNRSTEDSKNRQAAGVAGTMNIYNPNNDLPYPPLNFGSYNAGSKQTQTGLYGQVQLKPLDRWTFLLGGRLGRWETESRNPTTGVVSSTSRPGTQFTPLTSVIYTLSDNSSLYGSYAETFVGQTAIDRNGKLLDPRTGSQIEFGIKSEWFDKRVNTSFAIFRIIDKDRAIDDTSTPSLTDSIPGGKVRSQGLEAEVSGQVAPGWELVAGYAYTATKYLQAPVASVGQAFSPFTPRHSFNLWSKHSWRDGALNRWSLAGGLKAVSDFASGTGATRVVGDGYVTVSGQVGYQIDSTTTASLTVTNLFDKKYYEKVSNFGRQNFYGEPRAVMLAVKKMF
jgi:iron complex outermembrane receptor protein/outer membrane receptor for ferric coprogen and ferric-rhodotorulic acid